MRAGPTARPWHWRALPALPGRRRAANHRDANGEPTGVLIDNAMDLLEAKIPPLTVAETEKAILLAAEHLVADGLTSVHDAGISYTMYQAYQKLAAEKRLPLRIYAMVSVLDPKLPGMLARGRVNRADEMLSVRSVKISSDGALGSRGAALKAPYSDKPGHTGLMLLSEQALSDYYRQALAADFQVNVHAIGDKANSVVLDLFERLDPKRRQHRHRVEHAQVVAVEELKRFKQLGVLPSCRPPTPPATRIWRATRLGAARLKGAYAWRTLLDDRG